MTFAEYCALLDESPCTPRGLLVPGPRRGEMRVVRPPSLAEFRNRRATPRLDRARNLSLIHAYMLEKEERE